MNHTPGPWTIGGEIISHKSIEIASVLHFYQNKAGKGVNRCAPILEVADANARLIAAAPEMLEALKATIPHLPHSIGDVLHPALSQTRAAIAKAEGRG